MVPEFGILLNQSLGKIEKMLEKRYGSSKIPQTMKFWSAKLINTSY